MLLAEISDKMGTITEMIVWWSVIGIVFGAAALTNRFVAVGAFVLATSVALWAYLGESGQAYEEGHFSTLIWDELGGVWVCAALSTPWIPPVCVAMAVVAKRICCRRVEDRSG